MAWLTNDVIEVAFEGTMFNQRIMNILHFRVALDFPGPSTLDDVTALYNYMNTPQGAFASSFIDQYLFMVPTSYTLNNIRIQKVASQREVFFLIAQNRAGTGSATAVAANQAGVITWRTLLAGRTQRGSVHIPLGASDIANGNLTGLAISALALFADQYIAPWISIPGGWALQAAIMNRTTHAPSPIASYVVQTTARVQRRRTVGLGI